jgi:hypothetical protein
MSILGLLVLALGGAGLFYFLNPQEGRKRREQAREQASKALHRAQDNMEELVKNVRNRT